MQPSFLFSYLVLKSFKLIPFPCSMELLLMLVHPTLISISTNGQALRNTRGLLTFNKLALPPAQVRNCPTLAPKCNNWKFQSQSLMLLIMELSSFLFCFNFSHKTGLLCFTCLFHLLPSTSVILIPFSGFFYMYIHPLILINHFPVLLFKLYS